MGARIVPANVNASPETRAATDRSDGTIDLDVVHARLMSDLSRERGVRARLRSLPTTWRIALVLVAVAIVAALPRWIVRPAVSATNVNAANVHRVPGAAAAAVVYALILLAIVEGALRPLHVVRTRKADGWLVALGLLAPFALSSFAPGGACGPLGPPGLCFLIGTGVGWGLIALLRALDRGGHTDRTSIGLAACVAGLAANLALQFDCPKTGIMHRLTCHATIGVSLLVQYLIGLHFAARRERTTLQTSF